MITTRNFCRGEFVVEYAGELIDLAEARIREGFYAQDQNKGCYMYYFKHKGQQYWYVFIFEYFTTYLLIIFFFFQVTSKLY